MIELKPISAAQLKNQRRAYTHKVRQYVMSLHPGAQVWHGMGREGNSTLGRVVATDIAGDFPILVASFSDCNNPAREYVSQFNLDGWSLHGDRPSIVDRIMPEPPVPYDCPPVEPGLKKSKRESA